MKNKLRSQVVGIIAKHPRLQQLVKGLKTFTLPGFEGVPVYDVAKMFGTEIKQDRLGPRASAIAFNFLLALFPAVIFLFSLIPVIPIEGLQENLFSLVEAILPEQAFDLLRSTVEDIISKKRVDLLSSGFVLMIFFATNGVHAMMRAFAKFNPAFHRRSFFKQYGVSIQLTILLTILLLFSVFLIIGGEFFIREIRMALGLESNVSYFLISSLRWLIIFLVFFLTLSTIYYFGPALEKKWRFISLGSTVATVLSVLASLGFSFYVNNFGQYNKFYGSLGTVTVIMIWVYINALVLLFGFELNHSILLSKYKEKDAEKES